jgi:hypothetical protein
MQKKAFRVSKVRKKIGEFVSLDVEQNNQS